MSDCSTHAFDVPLKPCPFCGGEAEPHEVGFPYHYWDVWCDGECFDHFCEKPTFRGIMRKFVITVEGR